MLILLITIFIVFGVLFYFLGPRKFEKMDLIPVLINRTTIALLITVLYFGACVFWFVNFRHSNEDSVLDLLLYIIFGLPLVFPFLLGFTEGEEYGFAAVGLEMLFVIFLIRLVVPIRWLNKIKEKLRRSTHKNIQE
jgi:hypothetical protein